VVFKPGDVLSQKLEGPEAEERLKTIQERFKKAGGATEWKRSLLIGLGVFAAVVVIGLAIVILKPPPPPVVVPPPAALPVGLTPFDPFAIGYTNCVQAHAANVYGIPRGSPGYKIGLDPDRDGLACEPEEAR